MNGLFLESFGKEVKVNLQDEHYMRRITKILYDVNLRNKKEKDYYTKKTIHFLSLAMVITDAETYMKNFKSRRFTLQEKKTFMAKAKSDAQKLRQEGLKEKNPKLQKKMLAAAFQIEDILKEMRKTERGVF
jgi:hypothetical protein